MPEYVPERGDVVWLDFDPQAGHEQKGKRPALVLSPLPYNKKVGLILCCPITNQIKGYPYEVCIPDGGDVTGAVLADQVKSLDWRMRQAKFKCKVRTDIIEEVLEKLNTLL